ncbi:hypothetical protein EMCRGX_G033080 [Ephydatia muelleri]
MDFFRKAYDTLGSEISKTFDSSKDQPDPDVSLKPGLSSRDQDWVDTPNKSKRTDDEDSWGEWGTTTSTSAGTGKPQVVTETMHKGLAKTPPGLVRGDPSSPESSSDAGGGPAKVHVPWPSEASVHAPQDVRGNSSSTEGAQQLAAGGGGGGAEAGNVTPLATSTPAKGVGKSQLESLSREELMKYVKKQAQLLQKTKSRCDELTKECEQLKASGSSQLPSLQGNEALMGELQVLKGERDVAVAEAKAVRQTTLELEGEKKHLSSQLSSTREEYDLLRQSFRQLQDDIASREEDLRCQLDASHTRLGAITEQARDKEKNLLREMETLKSQMDQLALSNRELEAKLCAPGEERRGEEDTDAADGRGSQDFNVSQHDMASELASTKEELSLLKERCGQLQTSELRLQEEKVAFVKELLLSKETSEQCVAVLTREKNEVESDLGRRLSVAMATIIKEQEARERLVTELSDAGSRIEKLQESWMSADEQLRAVREEKESSLRSCEALKLELAAAQQRAHELEKEALEAGQARETTLREGRSLEEAWREEKRLVGVQSEQLKSELEDLRLQLKTAIEEKEEAVLELEEGLRRRGHELDTAKETSARTVSELESQLKARDLALEAAKAERDGLQASRDTFGFEVDSKHRSEVEGYMVKLRQLEGESRVLADARTQLLLEAEQMRCAGTEAEKRLVAMEKSNGELLLELQKAQEQRAKSAEALNALEEQDTSQKEELKKLKMFVVKLKKELNETKSKEASLKQQLESTEGSPDLQGEVRGLQAQVQEEKERTAVAQSQLGSLQKEMEEEREKTNQERQRLTEECHTQTKAADGLVRELEAAKSEMTSLQAKQLEAHSTVTQLMAEKENLAIALHQLTESRDLLQSEVNALQSDLSTVISEKTTHKLAVEAAQKELTLLREELAKERSGHMETREKLTAVEREAKANSVMDLELADYQRSVEQLRNQLSERDSKMEAIKREKEEYQKTLEQQKKEMETVKQRSSKQEENLKKLSAVVKTKNKELEDTRKQEGEFQAAIAQIQAELEAQKQLAEGAKVEVADLTARLHSTEQQSQASADVLQKIVNGLESKVSSLQGELKSTQSTLQATQQEYDSYKVRVHSVLKQKSGGPNEAEASRELRQKYETECIELKAELKGAKERLVSVLAEQQELTEEYERLLERHDQLMKDTRDTQERLTKKLQEAESRHLAHSQEQADLISQLRQEMHSMAATFKDQLHTLKESGQRVGEGLREELRTAQAEIGRLQREADALVLARAAAGTPDSGGRSLHLQEGRSSREGMEQPAEMESINSFPATPVSLSRENSQLSLEHLLLSTADSGADMGPTEKLSAAEARLRQQLKVAGKKMEHLTELLHESEASSLRLGEQTKLLKEEIRRLERNQQREESVANMEYLKNVFLQGRTEERTSLVPVIKRLLQLSPQEVAYIEQTLKGNEVEIPTAASEVASHNSAARKGWASYMQRWTGY